MGVASADRFILTGIAVHIGKRSYPEPGDSFPYEGKTMTCLGVSNKNDLLTTIVGGKQFIYTDQQAVLYDAGIVVTESMDAVMFALRTRQAPDKAARKKKTTEETTDEILGTET